MISLNNALYGRIYQKPIDKDQNLDYIKIDPNSPEEEINEMAFKRLKVRTGEGDRRDADQQRSGKHIAKQLGSDFDVLHHPKGGLIVQHKNHSEFHLGKASAKLHQLGIPHREEGFIKPGQDNRGRPNLYVLSNDASEHGKKLLAAQRAAKDGNATAYPPSSTT